MTSISLNGSQAVLLQQSTAAGWSLQNSGPGILYLGNDASVTPGNGYPVAVGVSLPLNAGAVLYGCTVDGQSTTVQLLQGAQAGQATIVEANVPGAIDATITNPSIEVTGNVNATIENASIPVTGTVDAHITNASIPVSGSVTATIENASIPVTGSVNATIENASVPVTGNVTIENASIPVTGTVDAHITNASIPVSGSVTATIENASIPVTGSVNATIENASIPVTGEVSIASGTVDISAGTVAVSGVSGNVATVPGAAPFTLASAVSNFPTAAEALGQIWTSGSLNVSAYCSIIIVITQGFAAGGPASINIGNYITADITNIDHSAQNFAPIHAEWLLDTSMQNLLRVPVTSDHMAISISLAKVATSVGGNVGITVYGSSQTVQDLQYISQSALLVGSCSEGGLYGHTQVAIATNTDYISSRYGDASVQMYGGNSNADCVVYAIKGGAAIGLGALYQSVTPAVNSVFARMRFPLLPIRFDTSLSSGAVLASVVQ